MTAVRSRTWRRDDGDRRPYLWFLHLDRRMSLDVDLGPLHIHLYGRAVFLMWVTVAILAAAGIAVLISRKPELIQKWRTWVLIAPVVGLPVWIGARHHRRAGGHAGRRRGDRVRATGGAGASRHLVLVALAVLYPLAAWLRPSLLQLAPLVLLLCALPSILERRRRKRRQGERLSPPSDRCGSAGRCHIS